VFSATDGSPEIDLKIVISIAIGLAMAIGREEKYVTPDICASDRRLSVEVGGAQECRQATLGFDGLGCQQVD